ncbi:MAG TPA: phosphopantetheine-binding protein [Polyangiaceae bacterium]|nr:phosphopantetheine-binding protein [Polyangiaceae bacterium]
MSDLEGELKQLIVTSLQLEDVAADSIDSSAPLFGAGLGLDSIDALELAVALSKKYGVHLQADDEKNREVFASVSALASFVAQNRKG